jgi:nucleoside transporter
MTGLESTWMKMKLRVMLSAMMFLQYAAWGAWMPVIGATLSNRFPTTAGAVVGSVFTALWLGCIFAPFAGQLVDRLMPSQVFLGITNLLAAGVAFVTANQKTPSALFWGMFVWALLFMPGTSIASSIAFQQIDKTESDEATRERIYSWVRSFGTFGWIAAAFVLTGFLTATHAGKEIEGPIRELQMTGIFGVIMGLFSFTLPNTPPTKERTDPLAFRKAFTLFRTVPGFAVFMAISFFAATEFMFFYNLSGQYLEYLKIDHVYVPIVKSISQITEVVALAVLLPMWLPKKGMRWCLLLGSFAWPLRYFIFAFGKPVGLVVASLGLHGFGYAFVLVVQSLYVDRVAPKDIRGSAQSLLTFLTLGLGNVIGSYFSGMVQTYYTNTGTIPPTVNWVMIFVLPAVTTLICAFAYMFTFRDSDVASVAASHERELEPSGV